MLDKQVGAEICNECANKDICKFIDDAERVEYSLSDIRKLPAASYFNISLSCPSFRSSSVIKDGGF